MPPDVPATVRSKDPEVVIGELATEIRPPVNVWPTEVTVPPPLVEAMVIDPPPLVMEMPDPAVSVDLVSVLPVVLPISNWPSV